MKRRFTVPILVLTVGVAWLLNTLSIVPDVDWVWTLGLAAAGVLTLVIGGITRPTLVLGPLLLVASICSVFRQTGRLHESHEIPILVIVLGLLLLAVQFLPESAERSAAE